VNADVVTLGLADLADLDRSALGERWIALFGSAPPRHSKSTLLFQALAWNLQLQAHPQWSQAANVRRRKRSLNMVSAPTLSPGARLLREWQGKMHEVVVVDEGFVYSGQTYRSLSAIARTITGTNWSGPQFFGLRK
jgi:hypothetical protein